MLSQRIAAAGHPVFRFDRRGIGDSDGSNSGFETSGPDIAAAIAAFRAAAPHVARIAAFGNCDAASRSEEHTYELQSLMRTSYAVFCFEKKNTQRMSHVI